MRRLLTAALVAVLQLAGARGALADSCDAWSCQPGCTPSGVDGDCWCEKKIGNDSTVAQFNHGGHTTRIVYAPVCTATGYSRKVQVYGTFSANGNEDIRELIVRIMDANNTCLWSSVSIPGCLQTGAGAFCYPGQSCLAESAPLPAEPRVVYVESHEVDQNSTATGVFYSDDLLHIACMPGCAGCASCCNRNCDDGNFCTDDSCNTGSGQCVHANNANACAADGNPCTKDFCSNGACYRPASGSCNDGNACTTSDSCQGGACVGGPAPNCDDGNVCTADSCDAAAGCRHTPVGGSCNDNNACTTGDFCQNGACVGGAGVSCDDGNPCTADGCVASSGCTHNPVGVASCPLGCEQGFCTFVSSSYPWEVCQPLFICGNRPVTFRFPYVNWETIGSDPSTGAVSVNWEGNPRSLFRVINLGPGPWPATMWVAIQSVQDNKYWLAGPSGVYATGTVVEVAERFLLSGGNPFESFKLTSLATGKALGLGLSTYPFVTADDPPPIPPIGLNTVLVATCQ